LSPSDFVLLLEKDNRVGQDQLFKAILEALLRGFLERFFPDEAARLNFDTLRFLGKEVFANVQARCGRRTWWPDSRQATDTELILVHVEVQAEHRSDFARRMFEYAVLRLHYRIPVFPIVLRPLLRGVEELRKRRRYQKLSSGALPPFE
jgi:hypothetical protein